MYYFINHTGYSDGSKQPVKPQIIELSVKRNSESIQDLTIMPDARGKMGKYC